MFCKVYQPFCIPLFVSGIKNPGNILYVYFAKCISLNVIFHIHQLYNFASSFFKFVKNKVHGISIKMTDTQVDAFNRGDSYINFFWSLPLMNSRRPAILRSTAVYQRFHVCRPLKENFVSFT